MTPETMLSNAAVASQNIQLLDDCVTRGAVLRSIVQWLDANKRLHVSALIAQIKRHEDFTK